MFRLSRVFLQQNKNESLLSPLISKYINMFPEELPKIRKVGREAEYPVTWADGSAADVRLLLSELAKNPKFQAQYENGFYPLLSAKETKQLSTLFGDKGSEFAIEVGWGTVEVCTGPDESLLVLKSKHEESVGSLVEIANRLGMNILGYGIQPRTERSVNLMTPRTRYKAMLEAMGPAWTSFTVTASDQLHVDICRSEIISTLNMSLLLTPVIIALCSNSPIYSGVFSGVCCGREYLMKNCQKEFYRHGMPARKFESLDDWFEQLSKLPFLINFDEKTELWEKMEKQETLIQRFQRLGNSNWSDFTTHERYVWHSARPRTKQRTIELRSPCQQPWNEHMVASALQLGIVEGSKILADKFKNWNSGVLNNPNSFQLMHKVHELVVREGLGGKVGYSSNLNENIGFDILELVKLVLDVSSEVLEKRGLGEHILLEPLYTRLEKRQSPAQKAVEIALDGGLASLIDHVKIKI